MDKQQYEGIEKFMNGKMKDSAHDSEHIHRVLNTALYIAKGEKNVDYDVLIISCLLHDIGRERQFSDPKLCHAKEGGIMAYEYLISEGWEESIAKHVKKCITEHRVRNNDLQRTIESKILFDADKLDVSGAIGIARTLIYAGEINAPIYTISENGEINFDESDKSDSFFHEYNYNLKSVYDKFYTKRGAELGDLRRNSATKFYDDLVNEITFTNRVGTGYLKEIIK